MHTIFFNPAQIVTVNTNGKNFKRGNELKDIEVVNDHSIIVENGVIKDIVPNASIKKYSGRVVDLTGKTILPGFVDCHTHTLFAGSRSNEFNLKLKGATYEDIANSGGGIVKTVESIRTLTKDQLISITAPRIKNFISQGVTTLEIKSGYGLDFDSEIKMLEIIQELNRIFPIDIIPTFLGAHTYPKEYKQNHREYIDLIINKMLPYISANNLSKFCDAFCETTAFSAEETEEIFNKAKELGFELKLHTEQFNTIGGVDTAIKLNAKSIEHLEVLTKENLDKVVKTDIVSVVLPGVSYYLKYGFAPARDIVDNNGILAVASDYNPGSCNIANIFFIMSLAALKSKLNIEEIISAYTINPAFALGISEKTGSIEINKAADFAVLNNDDYTNMIYSPGVNHIEFTIKNGKIIYSSTGGYFENYWVRPQF